MRAKPILISLTSDHHAGGTTAVCCPEGVRLDDGGTYHPSKLQLWLWERWERYAKEVEERRKAAGADLWVVYNGDAVEGDHHGTGQIISRHPDAQLYVSQRVFGVLKALKPERTFVVRGTEAHVGGSGAAEEALAKMIGAERDPDAKTWSRWHLRFQAHHTLWDVQHHGRSGYRSWTEANATSLLAADIFHENYKHGWPIPTIACRAHVHRFGDSHDSQPVRVLVSGSWQFKTGHAHKVATERVGHIGGFTVLVRPDEPPDVRKHQYLPDPPRIV